MPEGRAAASTQITEALTRGNGCFVVIGEAGIGKSTLLAEVADAARAAGMAVVTTRWSGDVDSPPMWSWSVLVRNWVAEVGSVDALGEAHPLVRRLVPDLVEGRFAIPEAAADEVAGRLALGDGLGRLIARSDRPVLVVLEDLHHALPGGLGVLEPFATAALSGKVVIAASTRELASAHGLTVVPITQRVALEPLPDRDAEALVRGVDPSLDDATVASVVARAEGNPFFLSELARLAGSSDSTSTTTPAVREVVLRRVDGLRDGGREVLALAALLGRKPKLDLLYAVVGDDELTDEVIDDAERARLLDVDGKVIRWNHDLVRESLTGSLRSGARRRLHGRVADALVAMNAADVFQLAHHSLASGATDVRTIDLGESAARAAAEDGAHEDTVRWVDRTLEALDEMPDRAERITRLQNLAGRSLIALQLYDEGKSRLLITARGALDGGDGAVAAAALMSVGAERLKGLPDYEPPIEFIDEALSLLVDDPVWTCRLVGRKADLVDDAEATRLSRRAVELAREVNDPNLLVTALGRVLILWHHLPVDEYAAYVAEIQDAAVQATPEQQFEAQAFTVLFQMITGDLDNAAKLIPVINASVLRLGLPRALAFHTSAACIHMLQGRFDEAQDVMQDHVDSTPGVANLEALAAQASLNGIISILRGDFTDFLERAQMFLAMTTGTPNANRVHPFVALVAQLKGEREIAHSSFDDAFRIGFDKVFEWVFGLGTPLAMLMVEALCAYDDERAFELESRLRRFNGYMPVGGMAPVLAFGAVDHQLALLARLRGDPGEARRLIDAAVALNRKMGAFPFVARSLLVSAEIADAAGDADRATADAGEAARLATRFEMRQIAEWSAAMLAKHGAAPVRGARVSGPSTAIVFTDIESSTASAAALGDAAWFERLRDHDTTVRRLVAHHGGREIKHLGDGFMVTFPSARSAVDFGVALQHAFTGALVRVRAGVHVGPVIEDAGDVFGTTVNVAARVSAAANGGETLVSEDVIALVGDAAVGEPRVATLKGVENAMNLYPLRA